MTNENIAEFDGGDPFDWAAREAEMAEARWTEGRPTAADIAAAQGLDPDADANLWPAVLDAKGKPTGELARPNPAAMHAALNRTAAINPAEVELLAESPSEAEARAIIAAAARQREHERRLDADLDVKRADLAAESAHRQAEHEARLAEARRRRAARAEAALERRDRALDPTGRVVRLATAERVVPWIAAAPGLLAVVAGAVNVGLLLAHVSPATAVVGWTVEPALTVVALALLTAQVLGVATVDEQGRSRYRWIERAVIATAVVLNCGLHVVVDGLTPTAAVWAIVPAGLALSMWLTPRLLADIRGALTEAGDSATGAPAGLSEAFRVAAIDPQGAGSRPVPERFPNGSAPGPEANETARRTDAEVVAEFADGVRSGRIDPSSAESIRRALRIRKERAVALRREWAAAMNDTE